MVLPYQNLAHLKRCNFTLDAFFIDRLCIILCDPGRLTGRFFIEEARTIHGYYR